MAEARPRKRAAARDDPTARALAVHGAPPYFASAGLR